MTAPRVSVVVPARDAAATLPALLAALERQEMDGEWEALLVDNSSSDGTAEIAARAGVRVVAHPQPGAAAARNAGVEAAEAPLVAFLDADCIPHAGWLRGLVRQMDDRPELGGVGGRIVAAAPASLLERYAERHRYVVQEDALAEPRMPYLLTANCCYRTDAVRRLRFDETLRSGEDLDLSWRLQEELGMAVDFAPDAVVEHVHRSSLGGIWRQWTRYGYGEAQLALRYPRPASRDVSPAGAASWILSRVGRVGRSLARAAVGRADLLDVVEPLLEYFEEAAERVGRRRGYRAERKAGA